MKEKPQDKYIRPYLVLEKFTPNEYVAGCAKGHTERMVGTIFFDYDKDHYFDQPEGRGTGNYLGGHIDMVAAGNFEITEQGRAEENGGLGYMFVGSGSFDYNQQTHIDNGTWSTYYDYLGSNFAPCLYAKIKIHYKTYTQETMFYYADDGSGVITTAS